MGKFYIKVEYDTMGGDIMFSVVVRPMPVDTTFSNNTWEQIDSACESNSIPDSWNIGDIIL